MLSICAITYIFGQGAEALWALSFSEKSLPAFWMLDLRDCASRQVEDVAVQPDLRFSLTFLQESCRTPCGKHKSFISNNETCGTSSSKHFQGVVNYSSIVNLT